MQLSTLQKAAAQAIVNIFETGSIRGSYGDVTLLPGDSGQLTYGRSQTTLASGNLFLLIEDYCNSQGALSQQFKSYLPALQACDGSLNHDSGFRSLLADAGNDPVMHEVQDAFFDRIYWEPAMRSAEALGAQSALGAAVVYDSTVHGSWAHVRDLTRKQFGELKQIGEVQWMSDYVETRREWLASYPNPLLHKTVYRMDAFRAIMQSGNWKLALPLVVRGLSITQEALNDPSPVKVPAEGVPRRQLRLTNPPMTGPDVSWLQERLALAGVHVADYYGTFDEATAAGVRAFQSTHDMKVDGVVGPVTRTALEDIPLTAHTKSDSPAATEPMPAVAPPKPAVAAPAAVAPAAVAPTTVAPAVQPSVTAPSATSDVTTSIAQHATTEASAAVGTLQRPGIVPSPAHVMPAPKVSPQRPVGGAAASEVSAILSSLSLGSRPVLAAAASVFMLLFTETRDAVVWVEAGLAKGSLPGINLPPLPQLPKSTADAAPFFAQAYAYLHALVASVPNEWMFRIRVAAIVLILYALYRLRAAHVNLQKIKTGLDTAQTDAATVRQDVSEAQQVVQDVQQVVRVVR